MKFDSKARNYKVSVAFGCTYRHQSWVHEQEVGNKSSTDELQRMKDTGEWSHQPQFGCILRFPALSLVPQSTSETYKYSIDVGDSEETAKGPGHALGHSENNSHSKAEDTAHHLQRLTQMTRARVELFVNDTCSAVWLHLSVCSREWEKKSCITEKIKY